MSSHPQAFDKNGAPITVGSYVRDAHGVVFQVQGVLGLDKAGTETYYANEVEVVDASLYTGPTGVAGDALVWGT